MPILDATQVDEMPTEMFWINGIHLIRSFILIFSMNLL